MKLRVLACAFACDPEGQSGHGAGEDQLGWNLINQLSRRHELWVLSHPDNRGGVERALSKRPNPALHFHYLRLPSWLEFLSKHHKGGIQIYSYLWQMAAYFAARSLHGQFRYDAFHHVTYANDWMASFIGACLRIPFVRGPGGGADRTPRAFLKEYCFGDRLWERFRSLGQWVLRQDPFFRIGQRRTRAILVCNREALERVPERYRTKANLFPVVGVSSDDLPPAARAEQARATFRVVSAGKLLYWKGFALAIRAFKVFLEGAGATGVGRKPELAIVGNGPELPRLQELVRTLGLEGNVRFDGWLSHDEVLARMRSCDVLLYASLRDGGGAVVVEALATGLPVVCLDLGGPGIHVTDDCGIKVPARSPEEAVRDLAAGLSRLYGDKERRDRMGKNARERGERVYDWDRLGERLLRIYEEALGPEIMGLEAGTMGEARARLRAHAE